MRAGGEGARCWYRAGCRSVAGSELLLHWDRRTPVAKKSATKKTKPIILLYLHGSLIDCASRWVTRLQSIGFPSRRRGDPSWETGDEPDMFRFLFRLKMLANVQGLPL